MHKTKATGTEKRVPQVQAAAGAANALSRSAGAAPLGAVEHEVPPDASKTQDYPLDDESYGTRSQFETEAK